MDIKKFTEWKETDDYKRMNKNSFVIVHDDLVNNPSLGQNFWSKRDIPDEWLKKNQEEYPYLNIRRMKVSDIIENNEPKFYYIKSILLDELDE